LDRVTCNLVGILIQGSLQAAVRLMSGIPRSPVTIIAKRGPFLPERGDMMDRLKCDRLFVGVPPNQTNV
jgi:hypothetical protein